MSFAYLALAVVVIAMAYLGWKIVTRGPCLEYATNRVPARVIERGRYNGGTTVVPAHDEAVCVKR